MLIKKRLAHFSPGRLILLSFLFTVFIGTILLALPISRTQPISLIDLLFTSTSATCVTGMIIVPLENFTTFGHCVLIGLMQIGGLGLVTMTLFFMSLFVNLGLTTQIMAGQLLEIEAWQNIKKIIAFIIITTLTIETVGTLVTYTSIYTYYDSTFEAILFSIFHAVSSFCNVGLSPFKNSMELFTHNPKMLISTIVLVFCGGFGFVTWYELILYLKSIRKKRRYTFSLHSKITLYVTTILLTIATLSFFILEHNNAFLKLSKPMAFLNSLFIVVASRSTGLLTVNIGTLHLGSILLIMIIAFIGSSPGSTGSGIKTTALAVFFATIKSGILGKTSINLKGRKIAKDQIYKTIAIVSLSFLWILFSCFCLLITEQGWHFIDILFESVSAFTTIGLTTGLTHHLSYIGKIFIILSMFIGRIGSLTLLLALRKTKKEKTDFSYPEERLMLS